MYISTLSLLTLQKGNKNDSNKSKKIFVGGIPHNCGEPELRDYFSRFGVVSMYRRGSVAKIGGKPLDFWSKLRYFEAVWWSG